jgi:hypothetical protein
LPSLTLAAPVRNGTPRIANVAERKPEMSLEQLNIVAECADCHRARPENQPALRRLHESIRFAGRHHQVSQIANAAGLAPAEVDSILQPDPAPALAISRPRGTARSGWAVLGSNQ